MEEWRPVVGWENQYEISSQGRLRSLERSIVFADGRVRKYPSIVRATYADTFGYPKVTLKRSGVSVRALIHHLVAAAWLGPRPKGFEICHGDGVKNHNAVTNLRYASRADNHADSARHGTAKRPGQRVLTDMQVANIRDSKGIVEGKSLAALFGTSKAHISNIQHGNRRV